MSGLDSFKRSDFNWREHKLQHKQGLLQDIAQQREIEKIFR